MCFFKLEKNIFTLHHVALDLNDYYSKKSDIKIWWKIPLFILLLNGKTLGVWISQTNEKAPTLTELPCVLNTTRTLIQLPCIPWGERGLLSSNSYLLKPFEICDT